MLAERTVRRLSIRAPADALARRAGFLIEDALRTASLPGDGAEILLLRRLRLPPFTAAASPQQVALSLETVCRKVSAVDGTRVDDAELGSAPAVRFADALTAHLSLTRLILAGAARQAWCWPLLVQGYRPALGRGAALRTLALSLAALPEAPAALPHWFALLLADGDAGSCSAFLRALQGDDVARLQVAARGVWIKTPLAASARWQSLLDWSAGQLGRDDLRHRWLLGMAAVCGMDVDRQAPWENEAADERGAEGAFVTSPVVSHSAGDGGDEQRGEADAFDAGLAAQMVALGGRPAAAPAAGAVPESTYSAERGTPSTPFSAQPKEATASDRRAAPLADDLPGAGKGVAAAAPLAARSEAAAPASSRELPTPAALVAGHFSATSDQGAASPRPVDAATAGGGLLFLVPLLNQLGLADFLDEEAASSDLPQRIFAILLRRLPIGDDDPLWLLCALPLPADRDADGEAARWLARCRRHLRRHVGIGLYSLVCRPARITICATHVDVRQGIDAVDLRIRRAGLDVDPGWVPWLGRVLRFHYGREFG